MVSKLLRCCFPQTKESIVIKEEFNCDDKNQESIFLSQHNENEIIPKVIKNVNNDFNQNLTENGQLNDSFDLKNFDLFTPNHNQKFSKSVVHSNQLTNNRNDNYISKSKTRVSFKGDSQSIREEKNDNEQNEQFKSSSSKKIMLNKKIITQSEEHKFPKLLLKTLIGDAFNNNNLLMTSAGLVGGLRNSRDTVAFFGCRQFDENLDPKIDYELNISNSNLSQLYSPIVFLIYFKKEDKTYYIKTFPQPKESTNNVPNFIVQIKDSYVSRIFNIFMIVY